MINPPADRISPAPFLQWPQVSRESLRADLQAGITVAIFAVPQAMAYAVLAGVPPVNGLYAAVIMAFVGSLFGSSPYLNTGPTNTASLLTASAIAPFAAQAAGDEFWRVLWTFTLLVGILRLALGLVRAGPLVRLVPEHAILGFVTAANILIALGQFNELLGAPSPHGSTWAKLWQLVVSVPQTDWRALLIGVLTVGILWGFDRFARRLPIALASVVAATLLGLALNRWLNLGDPISLVKDIAPVPSGFPLPKFYAPDLELMLQMLPGAAAVAAIGLLEAVSISSTLALKKKETVNFNQEFVGQGVAQIAGAFFQGFPGSSSYSRSALIERNGGKTGRAQIVFSLTTLMALLVGAKLLEIIPLAALAGLLLFTGLKLIDVAALKRVWLTSRIDFLVVALTFFVTFFGKLEWGFFAGIVAALLVFVGRARELQLFEMVPQPNGKWEERLYTPGSIHPPSDVVALSLHGDLFFGLAHELREQLGEIARLQDPKFIIIRLRRAHSMDASCWGAFSEFAAAFGERGGQLFLSGVDPKQQALIARTDVGQAPGVCLVPRAANAFEAFDSGLSQIAAQLEADAVLSPEWTKWAEQSKLGPIGSFGRAPANDPATLGAA